MRAIAPTRFEGIIGDMERSRCFGRGQCCGSVAEQREEEQKRAEFHAAPIGLAPLGSGSGA